jgi:aspartate beta-hydroxylase
MESGSATRRQRGRLRGRDRSEGPGTIDAWLPCTAPDALPRPVNTPNPQSVEQDLQAIQRLVAADRHAEADAALDALLSARPRAREAAIWAARLANQRSDAARAERVLNTALAALPDDPLLVVDLAVLQADTGRLPQALALLQQHVQRVPASVMAWLLLSQMLEDSGRSSASLMAAYEGVTRAQAEGAWTGPSTTPPHLHGFVAHAVGKVRAGRREVFLGALEELMQAHPGEALRRIQRAVLGYLGEIDVKPKHPRQRPVVLYIPDLPDEPYMDPFLHPWARRLQQAFPTIRREAMALLARDAGFEDFVRQKPGDTMERYLAGRAPAWEALFFYRHGTRYDENHALCPETSAMLESIDLFRVPGQAPEILFSVLRPGTTILAHHGICNARSVMHLPLLVPPDCALNLVDVGAHAWREGEPVLFDDTYLHEAWNRSDSIRMILLMDCWNPHLTLPEREAVVRLTQVIGAMDIVFSDKGWTGA